MRVRFEWDPAAAPPGDVDDLIFQDVWMISER